MAKVIGPFEVGNGVSYLRTGNRWPALSINEGGRGFTFYVGRNDDGTWLVRVYFFGRVWYRWL